MVSEAAGVGAVHGVPGANGIPHAWIDIRSLGKHFAGEVALRDVDMGIARGEVHGLVGANGAGKSTLIRCLAGVTVPDEGKILVDGEELRLGSPQASEKAGLAFIHQELNLVPHFSALQNMLLGVPKATRLGLIDWKRSSRAARAAAERVGNHKPVAPPTRCPSSDGENPPPKDGCQSHPHPSFSLNKHEKAFRSPASPACIVFG